MPKSKVVVLGSGGGIGGAIAAAVQARFPDVDLVTMSRSSGDFDLLDEASIAAASERLAAQSVDWIINATGVLSPDARGPEKSLRAIDPAAMQQMFALNTIGPALLIKHFASRLRRDGLPIFVHLSARVGSISDNRLGGWISYRSAKAALNQVVRTAAIELARSHPQIVVAALHPGTVQTRLSQNYLSKRSSQSASESAGHLLDVMQALQVSDNGHFFAWDGARIPF